MAAAVEWFEDNEIPLYGVNYTPGQSKWSTSHKAHANVYIDDYAIGTPMIQPDGYKKPVVDWLVVEALITNIINNRQNHDQAPNTPTHNQTTH
jgi:hypothetical protein